MAKIVHCDYWFASEDGAQMFVKWHSAWRAKGTGKHEIELHSVESNRVKFSCAASELRYVHGVCEGIEFVAKELING